MATRTYAVLHLSDHDHSILRSILSLLHADDGQWEEAEPSGAQVVFVGMDDEQGRAAWDAITDAVPVWCSTTPPEEPQHSLALPVKLKHLRPLVQRLEQDLAARDEQEQAEDNGGAEDLQGFPTAATMISVVNSRRRK
ncbi:hypothetical protein QWY84_01810 [Aquisalimonas lutea]|uniref:hypothetical protein n=1 Tax=Aquisalimonas lutea TaxID=1327750 RepID=UPI0025B5B4D7|nr:hypothetical protein [Aquisalimonas lutea]MDN3516334.1 hypothetical protein [Aquisalimonas lutea]